jgi:DNA repair photolyase
MKGRRRRNMGIIYEPKGEAREYAPLAANPYQSCSHGCRYCYVPPALKRNRETYYNEFRLKKNWHEDLKKDAAKLNGYGREILLSFVGDPYQPVEMELGVTRQAIQILMENHLKFTILTKGGTRAVRDFDLLADYGKARFGTSLVFINQKDADEWEPGAASVSDRIRTIIKANNMGIKTWVSLEPVIVPRQALSLIDALHPFVDHWKIGKLNHRRHPVDWIQFREDVIELLESLSADYYLKTSLTKL